MLICDTLDLLDKINVHDYFPESTFSSPDHTIDLRHDDVAGVIKPADMISYHPSNAPPTYGGAEPSPSTDHRATNDVTN